MAKSESIFSVRGIVRGYRERHLPGEVPAQIFFLAAPGEPEIPITLENTRIAMRDGHDLEIFYLHHDRWDSDLHDYWDNDNDLPLMVNNYSTQRLETLAASLLKKKEPEKPPLTTTERNEDRLGIALAIGFITFIAATIALGSFIIPLLVAAGAAGFAYAIIVPDLNAPVQRNIWDHRREMLEDYIKDKYGDLVTTEDLTEKPN